MINSTSNPRLDSFYRFFETYGTERLNGLSESYFIGLNDNDKEEAWNFLRDGFSLSADRITGLYILNKSRAVDLFKNAVALPIESSPFPAEQQAMESNRLLMLRYINSVDSDDEYVAAMSDYANSQFPAIRAEFARSLPTHQPMPKAIDAIKGMIFTETERIPLTSAITKFMAINGMDYDMNNSLYKSIYLSLRSNDAKEKIAGIRRLESNKSPDPE